MRAASAQRSAVGRSTPGRVASFSRSVTSGGRTIHAREELAEHLNDFLRRMPLGVPCEISDIEEHHRQVPDLAAELERGWVVDELVDHLRTDELLECTLRPQTLALLCQDTIDRDAHVPTWG